MRRRQAAASPHSSAITSTRSHRSAGQDCTTARRTTERQAGRCSGTGDSGCGLGRCRQGNRVRPRPAERERSPGVSPLRLGEARRGGAYRVLDGRPLAVVHALQLHLPEPLQLPDVTEHGHAAATAGHARGASGCAAGRARSCPTARVQCPCAHRRRDCTEKESCACCGLAHTVGLRAHLYAVQCTAGRERGRAVVRLPPVGPKWEVRKYFSLENIFAIFERLQSWSWAVGLCVGQSSNP